MIVGEWMNSVPEDGRTVDAEGIIVIVVRKDSPEEPFIYGSYPTIMLHEMLKWAAAGKLTNVPDSIN